MEAGGVGFEREFFSGRPDWGALPSTAGELREEERRFLAGPTAELCAMLDEWRITEVERDLPSEVWRFLADRGFFGLIIPPEYGGKGFSAAAHSAVVQMSPVDR